MTVSETFNYLSIVCFMSSSINHDSPVRPKLRVFEFDLSQGEDLLIAIFTM